MTGIPQWNLTKSEAWTVESLGQLLVGTVTTRQCMFHFDSSSHDTTCVRVPRQGSLGAARQSCTELQVSVPLLGTVGKWVRILGFDMAEKDESKQLAMNKAGVTVEFIGSNSGGAALQHASFGCRAMRFLLRHRCRKFTYSQEKQHVSCCAPFMQNRSGGGAYCGKTFSNVNCIKEAGDKKYRANAHDQHGDRFHVYRNPDLANDPRALCVRRVDRWDAGWGMQLEVACKVDNTQGGGGGVLIPMGMTHHTKKCVLPPQPVSCHWWSGNRGARLGFDKHDADFYITEEGGRICGHLTHRRRRRRRHRRRRRNSLGWDMPLTLECASRGQEIDYVVQDINFGKSHTNMRCILPTHRMECDWDAGNWHKRANDHQNGDEFHIWNSHTNHLCVKRTDKNAGWGMDLRVQCKQFEQLYGRTKAGVYHACLLREACCFRSFYRAYCLKLSGRDWRQPLQREVRPRSSEAPSVRLPGWWSRIPDYGTRQRGPMVGEGAVAKKQCPQ